ncbi:MAG: hypothetical protein EA397_20180 [Deltaproteobacteria bacterium]|nr:MAG: hypothetical protein EA397_20180 [Deltaproteobacteria bacterium]
MKTLAHPSVAILFLAVVSAWPDSAFAYLDAGTGSIILQSILGALFATTITVKLFWHRIKGAFGRSDQAVPDPATSSPTDEPPKEPATP